MTIVAVGNIGETDLRDGVGAVPVPRVGIVIEATPEEIAALPFNPAFAEVRIEKVEGGLTK